MNGGKDEKDGKDRCKDETNKEVDEKDETLDPRTNRVSSMERRSLHPHFSLLCLSGSLYSRRWYIETIVVCPSTRISEL